GPPASGRGGGRRGGRRACRRGGQAWRRRAREARRSRRRSESACGCARRQEGRAAEERGQEEVVKLICGLGNPGRGYRNHRHNIGFRVLEELCRRWEAPLEKRKFEARLAQVRLGEGGGGLARPQTFMNLTGEAVAAPARFFQICP